MKIKRKEIIKRARTNIELLGDAISDHEKDRRDALKIGDTSSASYHWGKISGLIDGINTIKLLIEDLEIR